MLHAQTAHTGFRSLPAAAVDWSSLL